MSSIQVADQTFVAAPGAAVAQAFVSPERWRRWWPDLSLTVTEYRGEKGIRWSVRGGVVGTMELWLEPVLDGVIVHYFLHAEPASSSESATEQHARRVAGRAMTFELKRELEAGRSAGEAPHHVASSSAPE
ncbi:polyketide cyclase / dehydrase and lipid transport [Rhodococcus fascians]|nr:polyketide cyclase / dehydrase and lipid transport [Rhodococcus fascians]MBY4139958.1 polyketide cyclase / dehydrase and lipid transport [Rhodococcus fascians]MBY4218412.1 polyketide cyclase / dehydrase and lipid transport [Rhodococcus fascians]MBY4222250.1 polyketide cyclase / dehydrase and lipid transport [Rhodococcus fascians]MBY4234520.1 polyketide cyclase / dehydrase and lipid transport [Rhodococcus fascians]